MKKTILFSACAALSLSMVACGGNPNKAKNAEAAAETKAEAKAAPVYNVIDKPQVDLATLPVDKEGYYVIFDGKTFNGWRGYGKDNVPAKWTIDDGAIKFNGTGGGEAQKADGGDLIFAHKFKNFELELEWKISKGGNSGILYLAQEVEAEKNGQMKLQPIYISSPEYQVLDNENHPDAKLGVDGNRKSASLYDMIPPCRRTPSPSASGTRRRSWFTRVRSFTARTVRTSWSTTSGRPSGRRCSKTASSRRRSGRSHSNCSTIAAARTTRGTSVCRITATTSGSATSASRCSTKRPFVR